MKESVLVVGLAAFLFVFGAFVGFGIGIELGHRQLHQQALERGLMEYDQRTGVLEWKADRQSFDNATEVWEREYKETDGGDE